MKTTWNPIPQSLPPSDGKAPAQGRFSIRVWLALADGTVVPGQCLHWDARRPERANSPVHSWFIEPHLDSSGRTTIYGGDPVAWAHIEVPEHPGYGVAKSLEGAQP